MHLYDNVKRKAVKEEMINVLDNLADEDSQNDKASEDSITNHYEYV